MDRIVLNLVTSFADERGNMIIRGRQSGADVEIELPGATAIGLMAFLGTSLPKLAKSAQGLQSHFLTTGYAVKPATNPSELILELNIQPDGTPIRFALPREILAALGLELQRVANTTPQKPMQGH